MTEPGTIYNVPRGTAYLTGQQAVVYSTSFIFYLAIARILTKSEVGEIALLATALAIFSVLTQMALPVAATRFISGYVAQRDPLRAGAVARTTLHLLLVASGPGLLLAGLLSPWAGEVLLASPNSSVSMLTTFLAAFLLDITVLYGAYFLGLGLYTERAYQNLLYIPLSRGLGIILSYYGLRVLGIALGWVIGALATVVMSTILWRGRLPKAGPHQRRPILAFSLPVFASALLTLGQVWGDILVLQLILMEHAATGGYYLVVSSVGSIGSAGTGGGIGFLSILWIPLCAALYPALAASYQAGAAKSAAGKLEVAFRLSNLTTLTLGASLAAVAPTALSIAYGPAYMAEVVPFALLTLTVIFAAQGSLLITTLQALGQTKTLLKVTIVATTLQLATVILTAGLWGTSGAALGRVFLSVATVGLATLALRPLLPPPVYSGMTRAISVAASVALPLALIDTILALILSIEPLSRLPVLFIVFTVCMITASRQLRVFRAEDFALVEKALPPSFHLFLKIAKRLLI